MDDAKRWFRNRVRDLEEVERKRKKAEKEALLAKQKADIEAFTAVLQAKIEAGEINAISKYVASNVQYPLASTCAALVSFSFCKRPRHDNDVLLLVAGCWLLVAGCWLLVGAGGRVSRRNLPRSPR